MRMYSGAKHCMGAFVCLMFILGALSSDDISNWWAIPLLAIGTIEFYLGTQ